MVLAVVSAYELRQSVRIEEIDQPPIGEAVLMGRLGERAKCAEHSCFVGSGTDGSSKLIARRRGLRPRRGISDNLTCPVDQSFMKRGHGRRPVGMLSLLDFTSQVDYALNAGPGFD